MKASGASWSRSNCEMVTDFGSLDHGFLFTLMNGNCLIATEAVTSLKGKEPLVKCLLFVLGVQ